MTYKRWDVVVVPYPFIDVGEVKRLTALNETQISRRIGTLTAKDRRAVGVQLKRYLP